MRYIGLPRTQISFSADLTHIGIGINYAIQFHNRLDEEFVKGTPTIQAMANTVNFGLMTTFTIFVSAHDKPGEKAQYLGYDQTQAS